MAESLGGSDAASLSSSVSSIDVVRKTLLDYARRGVFRGFDQRETEDGVRFQFFWLGTRPFHLTFDPNQAKLTVKGLLPGVEAGSAVLSDLDRLLRERVEGDLPSHRMVDPEQARVELVRRSDDQVDLVLDVLGSHHEYGVRKLLNLVNEIWVRLGDAHQRYLWEQLGEPME